MAQLYPRHLLHLVGCLAFTLTMSANLSYASDNAHDALPAPLITSTCSQDGHQCASKDRLSKITEHSKKDIKVDNENGYNNVSDDNTETRTLPSNAHIKSIPITKVQTLNTGITPAPILTASSDSDDTSSTGLAKNAKHISFSENQTVTVSLSMDDANLLQVKGDQIKGISCLQGYCSVQPIRQSGSALLMLGQLGKASDSGFTAYVTTTSGRQFSMMILPQVSVGQTIVFDPQGSGAASAIKFEKNSDYQSTLAHIITDMINYGHTGKAPDGYGVQFINDAKAINATGDLLVFPIGVFSGSNYNGLIYKVKNNTNQLLHLTAKQFYQQGVLAGALTTEQVKPQGLSYLYEVVSK